MKTTKVKTFDAVKIQLMEVTGFGGSLVWDISKPDGTPKNSSMSDYSTSSAGNTG